MEVRQFGIVVQHRLVHFQHLELLTEEVRLEKDCLRVHVRFLIHRQKPVPFYIIEAHHHTVCLRVQLGISPVLALLHASYSFNFMALKNLEIIRLRRIILPTAVKAFSVT